MGLINTLDMAKERVSALERMPVETSKTEMQKGKKKNRISKNCRMHNENTTKREKQNKTKLQKRYLKQ